MNATATAQTIFPELYSVEDHVVNSNSQRWAFDSKLFVRFSVEPVLNSMKSAEAGRPIFDEVEMITIITPGNNLSSVHAPMDAEYKLRFADRYHRWKIGQEEQVQGTMLASWGRLTVGQIAEMNALNIKTVEQLATLPDNIAQTFMGFHSIKQAAVDFIESSKDSATLTTLASELEVRDAQISMLQDQLNKLTAQADKTNKASLSNAVK